MTWGATGNIKGPKGDPGATGPAGPKGDPGATGPAGPAGAVPTVTVSATAPSNPNTNDIWVNLAGN